MQKKNLETAVEAPKATTVVNQPSNASGTGEKRQYNECKIQVRLTNGATMLQTFKPTEQLAAVKLIITFKFNTFL